MDAYDLIVIGGGTTAEVATAKVPTARPDAVRVPIVREGEGRRSKLPSGPVKSTIGLIGKGDR